MTSQAESLDAKVSLSALFLACLKLGLFSFGGGLTGWVHREFVAQRNWISEEDFASSLAIGQMLPGGNVVNLVVCLGDQLRGPLGSVAAVSGFLLGPFFAVVGLGALMSRGSDAVLLETALNGVAAAAIGLLLALCWRSVRRAGHPWALMVIAAVASGVGIFQLPLLLVVAIAAPVSAAMAWRRPTADA